MSTPRTPPRTELEERIALAYADGRGYTIERARRHVRNCIVQGPDSHHWDAVRPFAAQIIKPYWDGLLPLIRMAWNVLQPLLAEPLLAEPGERPGHANQAADELDRIDRGQVVNIAELPTNGAWSEYDWREVFPAVEGDYTSGDYSGTFAVGPGGARLDDVTAERIAKVVHFWAESPEGYGSVDFFAVVLLADGQFAVSEASADTTGWGRQADAWWKVGPTLESVLAELSEVNRKRIEDDPAVTL